ncbi:hypothetical protein FQR65_LT15162 [Abscondita terminalis]|nr:hypothetical protein FQR65_LT15162 [Abscondita terminalis]
MELSVYSENIVSAKILIKITFQSNSNRVNICSISEDVKKTLEEFRFRKEKDTTALILKVDREKQEILIDDIMEGVEITDLQEALPGHQPRYIIISYKRNHDDGRVSFPLCFIFYTPRDSHAELQMLYAGSKMSLQKECSLTRSFDIRELEELTEEWLLGKLEVPTLVPTLQDKNVIGVACGRNHTLFLTDTGTVYACGDNRSGQCGVGNLQPNILAPMRINYRGAPIVKVGCGGDFSVILDIKGGLHTFGLPEYGQLGHNTDGKYFKTNTKLCFNFETSPKHIGGLFMFGQAKRTGEANMYPKPVHDLTGWNIHCIAAGLTSIIIAADDSVNCLGCSSYFGELGIEVLLSRALHLEK